ncbi:hypothetical protein Glove_271g28 [Diversispora epigaea]|uniref:TLDc domain-containing protein n=1 Tax=Diversispora epigaea TaxID=1348612 RepID=A0A397I5T3_9GLOM|nr:hypothetical protein Glove_271g28 [Diversispora epigaea]
MSIKFFDKLSQNFIELLNDKDDYNVIVEVENEKSFTAHSNVLKCRSPYFQHSIQEFDSTQFIFLTHTHILRIKMSIKFFDKLSQNFIELLNDKDDYNVIVEVENEKSFTAHSNVLKCRSPYFPNEFEIEELIKKLENLLIETKNFTSLQESALVSLLKRDDLQLEGVIIWEYIIKWGIGQNSTLPVYLKEWNDENFTTLKITLQQCLPLIRYFHIPSTDIWKRDYLPEQAKPFSTIITYEHVAEISSWIDRKLSTSSLTNTPYEFQLILRGSINGFTPQTFWDICNGQASTVVIMKVKGTEEIFGGYNPLLWDAVNTGYRDMPEKTDDSFIFSLKNGNMQNSILSIVKENETAIVNVYKLSQKQYGPHFGSCFYMRSYNSNFTLDDCSVCTYNGSHEKPIRTAATNNFSIVDYEVFKVIKKTNYNINKLNFINQKMAYALLFEIYRAYDYLFKGIILDSDTTRSKINLPCSTLPEEKENDDEAEEEEVDEVMDQLKVEIYRKVPEKEYLCWECKNCDEHRLTSMISVCIYTENFLVEKKKNDNYGNNKSSVIEEI